MRSASLVGSIMPCDTSSLSLTGSSPSSAQHRIHVRSRAHVISAADSNGRILSARSSRTSLLPRGAPHLHQSVGIYDVPVSFRPQATSAPIGLPTRQYAARLTTHAAGNNNPNLTAAWYDKMAQMASEPRPDIETELEGVEDQKAANRLRHTIQKKRVRWLRDHWEEWRLEQDCTVAAVRRLIEAQPYCLWECRAFTSEEALRQHLKVHKNCIVPRYLAKKYQLTKSCLVKIGEASEQE